MIASLAEPQLSPEAKAQVQRLLDLEPGATLSSIATWADEIRDRKSAAWHYVNFDDADCTYKPERYCADGNCVVDAIAAQVKILKSSAPDAERLTALKFVVHLVADIHQPLHAGFGEDKGGNLF
ncbi:S1/P1 nuclease, partial [Roseateles sp.]|uniref:S1/P1 nuclease n=1 Tax=Roseateles sp. TaxID=1971397 RepID=UPI0037CC32C6